MKSLLYLFIIVCSAGLMSCSDKPARPAPVVTQSQIDAANARAASEANSGAAAATTPEPPQNAAGVWHYTCANGCAGGAGSAQACAVCGSTLAHNQAYHSATTPTAASSPIGATTSANNVVTTTPTTIPPPVSAPAEPPQNASGVWHYTCSNGCAGGAGSAVACATCGSTLVHNQASH